MTHHDRLKHIEVLSLEGVEDYLKKIHASTLTGFERTTLINECEKKISSLDRSNAFVEFTPLDDFRGH